MDLGPTQMWGVSASAEDESALGPTQVWGKNASTPVENKVQRRLKGKQQAPQWYTEARSKEDDALMALLAEACAAEAEDVGDLPKGALRQHVFFTHVTTDNPNHIQPCDFTREGFYAHLDKVFAEVYPDKDSPTRC